MYNINDVVSINNLKVYKISLLENEVHLFETTNYILNYLLPFQQDSSLNVHIAPLVSNNITLIWWEITEIS